MGNEKSVAKLYNRMLKPLYLNLFFSLEIDFNSLRG